ncbi:hypothetical protein D3C72_2259260 [compost metagenome]
MFEDSARHVFGRGCGNRDFKTVLAGIAGTRDDAGYVVKCGFGHIHEPHGGDIGPEFGEHGFGARPL